MRGIPSSIMSPEVDQRVIVMDLPSALEEEYLGRTVVVRKVETGLIEPCPSPGDILRPGERRPRIYFDGDDGYRYCTRWIPAPDADPRIGTRVRFPDTSGVTREVRGQVGWVVGFDGRYLIIMPEEESARRRGGRIDVVPAGAWRHSGAITYIDDSGNPVPNPRVLSEEPFERTAAEVLGDLIGKDVIILSLDGGSRSQEAVGARAKVTGVYGDPDNHQVFAVPYDPSLSGVHEGGAWVIDTWTVCPDQPEETVAETAAVVDPRAVAAIATIGAALIHEANDRGWCSEYDEVISALNERLPEEYRLPRRERRQRMTFTVTETITRGVTLSGMAYSAEEFQERVTGITDIGELRRMYIESGGSERLWDSHASYSTTVTPA